MYKQSAMCKEKTFLICNCNFSNVLNKNCGVEYFAFGYNGFVASLCMKGRTFYERIEQ